MTAKIIRIEHNANETIGVLLLFKQIQCYTLENTKKIIPLGDYFCRRIKSPKFGDTFEICDIKGRNHILFHKGNSYEDSSGCILLGNHVAGTSSFRYVFNSSIAFKYFMYKMEVFKEFDLEIVSS